MISGTSYGCKAVILTASSLILLGLVLKMHWISDICSIAPFQVYNEIAPGIIVLHAIRLSDSSSSETPEATSSDGNVHITMQHGTFGSENLSIFVLFKKRRTMIDLLIYHIHIVAVLYAISARWQQEGMKGAFLALGLCGLVFAILWALSGPIARMIIPGAPLPGDLFTADTLSLVLLLPPEALFFKVFFLKKQRKVGKEGATL